MWYDKPSEYSSPHKLYPSNVPEFFRICSLLRCLIIDFWFVLFSVQVGEIQIFPAEKPLTFQLLLPCKEINSFKPVSLQLQL